LAGKQLLVEAEPNPLQERVKRMLLARNALVRVTGQDYGYENILGYFLNIGSCPFYIPFSPIMLRGGIMKDNSLLSYD
jgi:hypothetical protein